MSPVLFCWQECKENQTSPNQLKEKMVKKTMLAEPIPLQVIPADVYYSSNVVYHEKVR